MSSRLLGEDSVCLGNRESRKQAEEERKYFSFGGQGMDFGTNRSTKDSLKSLLAVD